MHNAHKLIADNVRSHETGILCEMWGTHCNNYKEYYTLTCDTQHIGRNLDALQELADSIFSIP
jgi:hypothetical protein